MSITLHSKAVKEPTQKKLSFGRWSFSRWSFSRWSFGRSVKQKELFFFLSQLSMMLDVGISLTKAMETISAQVTNPYFKEILDAMVKDIEDGHQLSTAMTRHPQVFKAVYTNMIRSGEAGGFLTNVIDSIIELLEKKQQIRSRIRTAVTYPVVLCIVSILVTLFVLVGILPKFMVFFEGKYHILPMTTRAMMGLSLFLRNHWLICIAGGIVFFSGIKFYLSSRASRRHMDWLVFHFSFFSKVSNTIFTGTFLKTLGDLLNNGIPLSESISIAGNTIENTYYKTYVAHIRDHIEEGGHFSTGFALNTHIHDSVKQMITVGEEVGKLPPVMLKLANIYETETEENLKQLTSLIEPIALIFMGFVVWIIVSSIVLPMFRLAGAMN